MYFSLDKSDTERDKVARKNISQTHWMVKLIKVTVNQFRFRSLCTRTIDTAIKAHTLLVNFIEHTEEIKREAFLYVWLLE